MRRVVGQSIWHKMGQQKMAVWGGGGRGSTPLDKPYRYVPPKRQGFCAVQAWDKGYNNSQTPPPHPHWNSNRELTQVSLTSGASDIKFEICNQVIWLKERMQYEQVSISFVLDKKRDLEYILLTQETLTLLNSSKSWPFFFSCRWQIK